MRGHVIVGVMTIGTDVDKLYDRDLTEAAWALIAPMLPAARPGGRPRKINIRAVLNAIFYLLRTGCQWRLLPREFSGWSTSITTSSEPGRTLVSGFVSSAQSNGKPTGPPCPSVAENCLFSDRASLSLISFLLLPRLFFCPQPIQFGF
jgi:Putative transposase of IS4/5 family (DUF4096)